MLYISYFINAQSYYHNIKPKTFYIRGFGASPFFFSHHAPPPLVEVMSKSQTSKGCVLGLENRENKNSWSMTTWPLLLQIKQQLTGIRLPNICKRYPLVLGFLFETCIPKLFLFPCQQLTLSKQRVYLLLVLYINLD